MKLESRPVILVTGGASGLGRATVELLGERGARAVILDRDAGRGEELARGQENRLFVEVDVTDSATIQAAIERADETFGGVNGLIQCAGMAPAEKILARDGSPMELDSFRRAVEVNLIGTFNGMRLVAARLARNEPDPDGERGVIINTSSIAAFEGQIGQTAYASSKAGVAALTLPAARELAREGIRVMGIAPGIFDTPLLAGLPEKARTALAAQMPFPPRLGRPREFASLVMEILENPFLNGETVRLDGALRMPPR